MDDLAPDITRQRLLLEGFFEAHVDEAAIEADFEHITEALGLRTFGRRPDLVGQVEQLARDELAR